MENLEVKEREEERRGKKKKIKWLFIMKYWKVFAALAIVLLIGFIGFNIKKGLFTEAETTKIGFEDIGELSTQAAYCTPVGVIDASRKVLGLEIPFTQSKYIYSYHITIKAGINFEKVKWEIQDTTIKITLPEAEILSSEIDTQSFKVYHEDESIFRQISMEETNASMAELQKTAEKDAVDNGLLKNAQANAETILTGFFAKAYNLEEYKVEFIESE